MLSKLHGILRSIHCCEISDEGAMEKWKQDLEKILNSNSLGCYKFCKVNQIVLEDKKTGEVWNYFTNVHFSKKYTEKEDSTLLRSPTSIGKNFTLYISQYTMPKEQFRSCVENAVTEAVWTYTDSKIHEYDKIDMPFPTAIKYVAENDPSGSIYGKVIPLEKSLYGSNFSGNYYIFEVYAKASHIKCLLTSTEREQIQKEIRKCEWIYNLEDLEDRIGNVVCKFDNEVLKVTPISLGNRGIIHQFKLADSVKSKMKLHFRIEQEHDGLLYECKDQDVVLRLGKKFTIKIQANQCKTTITVSDKRTGLVLFRYVSDQSVYSSYRGQISAPKDWISVTCDHQDRKIKRNGEEITIPLSVIQPIGAFDNFIEMLEAGKRQQHWEDKFFKAQKYLNFYEQNGESGEELHKKALEDIKTIINDARLLWDLNEICIIDPYLSADDILDTVVFCEKKGVCIRCLTDLQPLKKKEDIHLKSLSEGLKEESFKKELSTKDNKSDFDKNKIKLQNQLEEALGQECDLGLSFRTVCGTYGCKFHDRYLILRYKLNKTRVWSLGTSINSLGKYHHIIQIVESPTLIEEFFDKVWKTTNNDKCKIYESNAYKISNTEHMTR